MAPSESFVLPLVMTVLFPLCLKDSISLDIQTHLFPLDSTFTYDLRRPREEGLGACYAGFDPVFQSRVNEQRACLHTEYSENLVQQSVLLIPADGRLRQEDS